MREILYRGKCKNNGRWFEGFPFQTNYDGFKTWCISTEPLCANEYSEILGDWAEVIPETIGQYTGVTDKNDKKIFEGDILKFGDFIVFVIWNDETLAWECQRADDRSNHCHYQPCKEHWGLIDLGHIASEPIITGEMTTEIIGNIHDDPELMELMKGGVNNDR